MPARELAMPACAGLKDVSPARRRPGAAPTASPQGPQQILRLQSQAGNRAVLRLLGPRPAVATLQRAIPAERKVPHNDQTTQEMEIQIDRAMKLMDRRDMEAGVRMRLMLAIQNARAALADYRDSISTVEPGMRVTPMTATTTTNPVGALWAAFAAFAVALFASASTLDPSRRPPAEALAEALRELVKPVREIETAPRALPAPEPQATAEPVPYSPPDEPRRQRKCTRRFGPPAGGDPVHDAYARHVAERHGDRSTATLNYFVADDALGVDFDHFHADANEYFEVKTRHEIVMREWARNQPLVVARLLDQASNQLAILRRCGAPGWHLVWYFDDPGVAQAAGGYLPAEIEVRHEPWPGGQRPTRRQAP